MTIEERFEKLEKQNRRLRRLSLASLALALAALVGGTALSVRAYTAAIEPDKITTKMIILNDLSGKKRVVLDGLNGGLGSYDANGKLRAYITSDGKVAVTDSNGQPRVSLGGYDGKIIFQYASGVLVKTLP